MTLPENLQAMVESLSTMLAQHFRLLRLELAADAKAAGGRVIQILAFLPLLFVAYVMGCVALALALEAYFSPAAAFALVALGNLVLGAAGIGVALLKLRSQKWLSNTTEQTQATVQAVTQVSSIVRS